MIGDLADLNVRIRKKNIKHLTSGAPREAIRRSQAYSADTHPGQVSTNNKFATTAQISQGDVKRHWPPACEPPSFRNGGPRNNSRIVAGRSRRHFKSSQVFCKRGRFNLYTAKRALPSTTHKYHEFRVQVGGLPSRLASVRDGFLLKTLCQ